MPSIRASVPIRREDLSSVTASIRPPDSSRAPSALVPHAGMPMRMAVAMVSG